MTKEAVSLGTVQETLLIPLYGRARDAKAKRPVLGDAKAVELVDRIDYDFSKFRGPALSGCVLRSAIFDVWIRRFLRENPTGTVIELGTGLNTRSYRLDNGKARWFDLDLPDSIELRRAFFDDTDRMSMIAGSVLETDWHDEVAATKGPYFFVGESVLFYLRQEQVRSVIQKLGERFPGSMFAFDTGGRTMMTIQHRNPIFTSISARMQWPCDDPSSVESWGLRLLDSRTFANPQPELVPTLPWQRRLSVGLMARLLPPVINTYKINLFSLS